jgi:hypothetical protein
MKLGKKFKIGYIDDDGRFCPLAFAQSCSIDMKASSAEVSSPLTGGWVERRVKRNSWSMQHEGLLGSDTTAYKYQGKTYGFWGLMRKLWQDKYIFTARWTETDTSLTMQGQCFIEDMSQVASEKALTKISVKLSGTGRLLDLSIEDISGAFAYDIQGHTLTLYTVQRPLTGFTVHAGDTAVGLWDEAAAGRTQSFTNDAITSSSVITAWKGEGAAATQQTGVTFTDCTTLHVVLLQTEERDEQQQLHRYVQPLWWGGLSMSGMTLKLGTATVATFATAGLTGSAARVEIDPTIDITASGNWSLITDAPQTLHCCDRTTSLLRTLRMVQTQLNAGESPYMGAVAMEPAAFSCQSTVWGNDDEGAEVFNVSGQELPTLVDMATTLPDALHLHWQMTGLGVDESGPYTVQRELVSDMERHDVFYAYDATAQKLRVWCPSQVLDTSVMAGGSVIYTGNLYDLDSEGNRVPLTISDVDSFSTLSAGCGNYRFIDVSALTVLNLSNTLTISALPLDDIILTGEGGAEVGRIPALSSPDRTYPTYEVVTTPGSVVTGAHMETGAVQSLTYQTYFRTVIVKTTATYNATAGTWSVTASLRGNSDGSGGAAVLPGRLDLRWSGNAAVRIAAGQSSVTASGLDYNPAWIAPTAKLISTDADSFNILTAPTPDITAAHWTAYKIGLVGGYYCYDIAYLGGSHPELSLTSSSFMFTPTVVKSGEQVADTLYRLSGSSVDSVSINAKASGASDWSAATVEHVNVNTTDKLVLSYQQRDNSVGTTVTDLTNIDTMSSSVPVYSRKSCIADVLPRVGVVWRVSTVVYADKSLEPLTPGKVSGEEFRVEALAGVYSGDDSASDITARFTDNQNNVIDASGVTGVEVRAVTHGAVIFPRS